MKPGTIEIKGKEYKYSFKQKARRLFMEKRGLEYWPDYGEEIMKMEPHPEKGMSVAGQMIFADLIITAIQSENPDFDLDPDELMDLMVENPGMMKRITSEFSSSQEQEEPGSKAKKKGNPSSSGRGRRGQGR